MSSFLWNADGSDLPSVEAHTKARHRVTEDYVKDWIITLCGNNIGKSKKVTLIDGFCGGGMYVDEETQERWPGSPIRLLRSVKEGLEFVKQYRGKPNYELDAKFIFVDSKKEHIECLKKQIFSSELGDYAQEKCDFICSEFEIILPKIMTELKQRRGSSLFILDPTGYTDVSMHAVRTIINLGKTEILYTFMIDFITRFVRQRETTLRNAFTEILEADGFFKNLSSEVNFETQDKKGYIRNETLRLFRQRGRATYAYSFALLPSAGIVKYYLIHLATNPTAQKVIKFSLWAHNNLDLAYQFRYSTHGLGFRSTQYYEANLSLLNIEDDNTNICIQNLGDDLIPLIDSHTNGIDLRRLHETTMQKNPATFNHYIEYLLMQRDYGEIEILRGGKPTRAKNLKADDVICRPSQQTLFDMRGIVQK